MLNAILKRLHLPFQLEHRRDRIATLFVIAGAGALLCWLLNVLIPVARQYDQMLQQDEL
jgi:hypothetical protein